MPARPESHFSKLRHGLMTILSLLWLLLLSVDLSQGLPDPLKMLSQIIWLLIIVDTLLALMLSENKIRFFKSNWLLLLSIMLPALRIFHPLWLLHAARSLHLLNLFSSLEHNFRNLGELLQRRGTAYIASLSLLAILAGAAGMMAFEDIPAAHHNGLHSYASWVWWTLMLMTNIGSDYFPQTPAGRTLCAILSIYAFGVFGYLTAFIASLFIDSDLSQTEDPAQQVQNNQTNLESVLTELKTELSELRQEVHSLREALSQENHSA